MEVTRVGIITNDGKTIVLTLVSNKVMGDSKTQTIYVAVEAVIGRYPFYI